MTLIPVQAVHQACVHELPRATGEKFLGVLDDEAHLAVQGVRVRAEFLNSAEQHSGVTVMSGGVNPRGFSDANDRPVSSWMGRASMSARSSTVRPGRAAPFRTARTLVGVGRGTFRFGKVPGASCTHCAGLVLAEGQVRMLVQPVPPGDDLLFAAVQGHGYGFPPGPMGEPCRPCHDDSTDPGRTSHWPPALSTPPRFRRRAD